MIITGVVIYFSFNKSYILSLEAKYYFEIEEFDKAYKKAKEAYILDPYNKMAFSIYTQSQIAKEWQNFINDAKEYFKKIREITNKQNITKKDKLKIKIMLEILIDQYKSLKKSLLINKSLKQKAKKEYLKIRRIYEEVFGKRS